MKQAIRDLGTEGGWILASGCSEERIRQAESALEVRFPDELRAFYLATDGFESAEDGFRVLPLRELVERGRLGGDDWFDGLALLPVGDSSDSDPLCVCSSGPLAGFVIHVRHDGDSRIRFRSWTRCLEALAATEDLMETLRFGDAGDFPSAATPADDQRLLSALLREIDDLSDEGVSTALSLLTDLVPDTDVARLMELADRGDEYVRDRVHRRLRRIGSREAREALGSEARNFRQYLERVAALAGEVGVAVRIEGKKLILERSRVPVPLNHEMLFDLREEAGFEDRVRRLLSKHVGR